MEEKRVYDLEERTFQFALRVRRLISRLPKTIAVIEDGRQVIRSSGSIGANYIEANQALSAKDRCMRLRISRKEARETQYWLTLLQEAANGELESERRALLQEVLELSLIFSRIITKLET